MTETASTAAAPAGTLLFVDDEPNILASLRRLFRPLGYTVYVAGGGKEGLAILEQENVDLVISDMRMPEMDGAAFLEQVARRWPQVMRILLTGFSDVSSAIAAVNQGGIYKYVSKPWDDTDIKLSVRRALELKFLEQERRRLLDLTQQQNDELRALNQELEKRVAARTEELRQTFAQLEVTHESLKKSYMASVKVFSNLVELREGAAQGHSRRVADVAHRLAARVGLSTAQCQDVLFAALLHDIGKIGLPDRVINKPFESLEQQDRLQVLKHPVVGEAVLMFLEPLQGAARIIRHHHERYDGKGYPDQRAGKDIPLGACVLAVANDYDALQAGTLNGQRLSAQGAREHILRQRGKAYDPDVVDAFMKLYGEGSVKPVDAPELTLKSKALKPGMVLSRDLLTRDGVLLLSRGYALDDKMIERIENFERAMECDFVIHVLKYPPAETKT
jgi:response regulator RpfG family c-di-GMP phosphodiesterase